MSDLREALEAAVTEQETPDEQNTTPEVQDRSADEPQAVVEKAETSDVETAAEDKDVPAEKPEADTTGKPAEVPAAQTAEQARQHRIDRPPQSWKKEAKGEWANIPLHVRQEVYRREQEVARTLQEVAPARQLQQEFQQTVQPYMARLQSAGVEPMQAVKFLMDADFQLATATPVGKAQLMAKLIQDYGVDITALDEALVGNVQQQPQQDITQQILRTVEQKFAPVLTFAQQQQQLMAQQQMQRQQEAQQAVEQMAVDPAYPYFDEVREEMADLIEVYAKRGVYITPQQAYTKATQLNPDIAAELQRQSTMSQAQSTHQQAQRAKQAASSVSGAPASGGSGEFVGDGSLRGAIEAAFGNARV